MVPSACSYDSWNAERKKFIHQKAPLLHLVLLPSLPALLSVEFAPCGSQWQQELAVHPLSLHSPAPQAAALLPYPIFLAHLLQPPLLLPPNSLLVAVGGDKNSPQG